MPRRLAAYPHDPPAVPILDNQERRDDQGTLRFGEVFVCDAPVLDGSRLAGLWCIRALGKRRDNAADGGSVGTLKRYSV